MLNSWGYNSSFGVFQTYYTTHLDSPASQISWIGSVQISTLFFIGTLAGRLTDAGYFRVTFAAGTILTCLGVFMTSLSTTFWQLLLAQGLCTGLGNGLMFTPSLAVVSTYFKRRRALAFGITVTGSATGGLIFPSRLVNFSIRSGLLGPLEPWDTTEAIEPMDRYSVVQRERLLAFCHWDILYVLGHILPILLLSLFCSIAVGYGSLILGRIERAFGSQWSWNSRPLAT
ncbi:hypothetical protein FSARC_14690 [Fusarium sarcochroum]|uniref:Major facilitator superfamily (MFS) profile domain-containing protein n=1 Tax=Fusarium sarcochroum TaxID=1208366 RepID=A0A8H4SRI0_9HYPO|nr:hypothetical protein FSARC_14690 [Fusarium sarcochroum]